MAKNNQAFLGENETKKTKTRLARARRSKYGKLSYNDSK